MAVAYTKDFLVNALCSRYSDALSKEAMVKYRDMANSFYDEVGKDKFRVWASLDAEAIREYKRIK